MDTCLLAKLSSTPSETPQASKPDHTSFPSVYRDLAEVFSESRAWELPPHHPYDCAINLMPGTSPPGGRLFFLVGPEKEAMDKYIRKALVLGFIRPSSSPAGAGLFLLEKRTVC